MGNSLIFTQYLYAFYNSNLVLNNDSVFYFTCSALSVNVLSPQLASRLVYIHIYIFGCACACGCIYECVSLYRCGDWPWVSRLSECLTTNFNHIFILVFPFTDWFHKETWPISYWFTLYSVQLCTFIVVRIFRLLIIRNVLRIGEDRFIFYTIANPNLSAILIFNIFAFRSILGLYSILGSSLFSLGSVLVWAIIKSSIPRNVALATTVGLASGYAIARLSYDYLNHVDSLATNKKPAASATSSQ